MTNKFIISFITLIVLVMSTFSCSDNSSEAKVNLSDAYACDDFRINSEELYGMDKHHTFRTKIVKVGSDTIDKSRFDANLKDFGDRFNISFRIEREITIPICSGTISYQKMLEENYTPGYITIMIFCDSIKFTEERGSIIQGAALGVPTLDDPTLGKPIFFVRKSVVMTKVLHHEGAHLLSIQHNFKGYDNFQKGLTCNSYIGDGQPDTVTPLRTGSVGVKSCKYYAPPEALKDYTDAEIDNMVKNIMSYSSPGCLEEFTESQIEKGRKMIEINARLQDCIISL